MARISRKNVNVNKILLDFTKKRIYIIDINNKGVHMVTFRLYNKQDNKLIYRIKLHYSSNHPEEAIQMFAEYLDTTSGRTYKQYAAYAKDGNIIAREAAYKGV